MNKKLYRLKDNTKVSGVCGGISEFLGVDVTVIRLLWVLGSLFNILLGVGMYVACVFIIPEEPEYYDAEYKEKI